MTTPAYVMQSWADGSAGGTPLSASRMLHMEQGIENAEESLVDAGVKTANYTAVPLDFIRADMSGSAWAIQLPTAPPVGSTIGIKIIVPGNVLTINRGGTDVFNKTGGSTSLTMVRLFQTMWLEYNGAGIWVVTTDGWPVDFSGVQATLTTNTAPVEGWHNPYDATSGNLALTMPTPSGPGRILSVMKIDASTHTVTMTGNFEGTPSTTLTIQGQWETMEFISKMDGSWWRLASHKPKAMLDALYTVGTRITSTTLAGPLTTASTSPADVAGATVTFTAVAGQTYELRAKAVVSNATAGDGAAVVLADASNAVQDSTPNIISRTATDPFYVLLQKDVSPAGGSVTYKLRLNAVTGGTASIGYILITVTRVG